MISPVKAEQPPRTAASLEGTIQSDDQPYIIFVDDDPQFLDAMRRNLASHRNVWRLEFLTDPEHALRLIRTRRVDLLILDLKMPGLNGFSVLERLRNDRHNGELPVIVLTGLDDAHVKQRALELGALDLFRKPVRRQDLIVRIHNALRIRQYENRLRALNAELDRRVRSRTLLLEKTRRDIIWILARAGEFRDEETGHHIMRVGLYCRVLAQQLGMQTDFVETIAQASPLHDIGKIGIPDAILLKTGPLNQAERFVMESHCNIGYHILQQNIPSSEPPGHPGASSSDPPDPLPAHNPILAMAAHIAISHHEHWDGSGYPNAKAGEQIPLEGRIVAVADVYDALSFPRPYKHAYEEEQVLAIMRRLSRGQFDTDVYAAFMKQIKTFREIRHQYLPAGPDDAFGGSGL